MAEGSDDRGSNNVDYLLLGHVTVDRLDEKRVVLGGTATYAALTARNMGARVGVHTSTSYEPGLIDTLGGVLVARIPAEYTSCFVNEYTAGKRRQTIESVAEKLTYEQILPEWRNPAVVHLGPLCQEIDASLRDVYETLFITANPICVKAALNLLGHPVGGLRLPLVPASEQETEAVRAMLERHGLLVSTHT